MKNLINIYVTKENIKNYANKEKIKLTNEEVDFIYNYIHNNYINIMNNKIDFNMIEKNVNKETYIKIIELYETYKKRLN